MDWKLDIFKKLPDGHPLWLKTVVGMDEAKRQLDQLTRTEPGEYFIFNARNGQVIAA